MQKQPDASQWIQALYEIYNERLCKVACARLSGIGLMHMADDVVQETMRDALENYEELINHKNIGGWLYKSVDNRCRNLIRTGVRRRNSTAFIVDDPDAPEIVDPSAEAAFEEAIDETPTYQEAIDYLRNQVSEEEYKLFEKVCQENHSAAELSEEYGVSVSAMGMRVTRLKRKMVKMMARLLNILAKF